MASTPAPMPASGHRSPAFRLGAVLMIALGVTFLIAATGLGLGSLSAPGPGMWPSAVAAVLALCGLILLVTDSPDDYEDWTRAAIKPAMAIAALVAYAVLFAYLSFVPSTLIFLIVWFKGIARESWFSAIATTAVTTAVLYAVFAAWLQVPFPAYPWAL